MDLTWTESEEQFRAEVRTWLEANVPAEPLPSGDTEEGFRLHQEWEKKLFDARYSVVSWPEEYGGRGASLWEWLIFEEEYYRVGAPQRVSQNGIFLLAPIFFEYGTDWQKERYLRPMAEGVEQWGQGWSEPDAGSDLAGIKSRATQVDGGWRVTGQKTWTTRGAFCTHLFGLFRTDPEAERHRGMSYLLIPLDAEGVTVRGVSRLDGDEGFAEVFFEDVFVPDQDVLGGVNEGWRVAMTTTSSERGLTLRSPGRFTAAADRLIDLHRRSGGGDQRLADQVVQAWMDAEAYQLSTFQTVTKMLDGQSIGAESSLNKIFWSEMDVRMHETALELLGARAELIEDSPGAVDGGGWMKGFQFALAGPIYAGTNEIQRNVVAERVLGLPRKVEAAVQFSFTEDQRLFADTVRDLLTDQCPPSRVRAAWEGPTDRALWSQLGEMGVLGLMAPESAGGMGMTELDLVLLLVETGRCAMPDPVVDTAAVAVPMLAAAEHPALAAVAGGESAVAVGFENDPLARVDVDQLLLQRDDAWHLVPVDAVSATPEQSVDGARRLATVQWDPSPESLVTDAPAVSDLAFDRAVLGVSAQLLGLADHLLTVTVEYVQEREQFGRPIGSYQALKHKLADVLMALDFARPMVARAAYSLAEGDPSASVHVSMAKAYAAQAGLTAATHALQCHGAIAYTVEYDLHMWMKRVWALSAQWGDAAWHRRRVGAAIL